MLGPWAEIYIERPIEPRFRLLTCVIDPRNILVLGGQNPQARKTLSNGFIMDHQTAEVSKLVSTELAMDFIGN